MTDLPVHTTARGFDFHTPIPSEYGGHITVSESSAADGPHVWVRTQCPVDLNRPDGPTVQTALHLTADNAWMLARQLAATVTRHYQGDARPADAPAISRAALSEALPDLTSPGGGLSFDRRDVAEHTAAELARRGFALIHIGTVDDAGGQP